MSVISSPVVPPKANRRSVRRHMDPAIIRRNLENLLERFEQTIRTQNGDSHRYEKLRSAAATLAGCFRDGLNSSHRDLLTRAKELAATHSLSQEITNLFTETQTN